LGSGLGLRLRLVSVYVVWCKNLKRHVIFSYFSVSYLPLLHYAFHRYPIRDVMRCTYPPVGNGIRDAQQRFNVTHSATSQCNPILTQTKIQLTVKFITKPTNINNKSTTLPQQHTQKIPATRTKHNALRRHDRSLADSK